MRTTIYLKLQPSPNQTLPRGRRPMKEKKIDRRISACTPPFADQTASEYVLQEARRVADMVLAIRKDNSLVFGAASDFHTTGSDESAIGIRHAGEGMKEIHAITRLDLVALFGDMVVSRFDESSRGGFAYVKSCFSGVSDTAYLQLQGNHDLFAGTSAEQVREMSHTYIGANNIGAITDDANAYRNYGYRDFDHCKIRVIFLNTADNFSGDITNDCIVSDEQLKWLRNVALALPCKDWGIVVFTHHPLNWRNMDSLRALLDEYKQNGTGAELLAHFHGHLHNFRTEKIGESGIVSITIPNACFWRNNEYGMTEFYSDEVRTNYGDMDSEGKQRQFNKTADTKDDTAFNIVVIDRGSRIIHCLCYGAGIDRRIDY